MKTSTRLFFLFGLLLAHGPHARGEVRLANIFADHMVFQRDRTVHVWGWADPGGKVTVEFAAQSAEAVAAKDGAWSATLESLAASAKGQDLRVRGGNQSVVIQDIVVGDVWYASGQSNMAMTVGAMAGKLNPVKPDITAAKLPAIRFCRINETESAQPSADLRSRARWTPCSSATVPRFSGVAFYFARQLHQQLGVPIGVIDSSRGGTPIEPFIPRAAFGAHPTLRQELELGDKCDLQAIWRLPGGVRARDANWLPSRLYNSRLAPITRFGLRGCIWYQGESNCGDGEDPRDYQHKMRALINGWRKAFGNDSLPFYFVQLPGSGARAGWPYLREQQRLSANLPHTGMVVSIDLLDNDIHPPNKIDVGKRLARWALAGEYGKKIPYSGPLFQRAQIADGHITVCFSHAETGLMIATKDGLADPMEAPQMKLSHFELADTTGRWHPAEAVIRGSKVVVSSADAPKPVAVRYGYAVTPLHCNLYNRDGLPASPFCSDSALLKYVPELPTE